MTRDVQNFGVLRLRTVRAGAQRRRMTQWPGSRRQSGGRAWYLLEDSGGERDGRRHRRRSPGQMTFDKGVAQHLQDATDRTRRRRPFRTLTDREIDIFDRLARGLSNQAIAARIGVKTKTVQSNVSNIELKLG